jgi:hypothetical protein
VLLKRAGFLDNVRLEEALRQGAATGERLGEVVTRRGWASEDDVARLLADQWDLGYVERASIWFDADALARMSRSEARRLKALPTRIEDGHVVVAVAEPTEQRLAALRKVIGDDTVVVVVPKSALDAGLSSQLLFRDTHPSHRGESTEAPEPDAVQEHDLSSQEPAPADPPDPLRAVDPESEPEPEAELNDKSEIEPEAVDEHEAAETDSRHLEAPAPEPTPHHEDEPELAELLVSLHKAAQHAASLQREVGQLAGQLDGLAGELIAVSQRIAQRSELTDRLKAQMHDLTRTLDTLQ